MKTRLSRSKWVAVKTIDELMTSVVTRTIDCTLCGRKDCIAIVTGNPRIVTFDDGDSTFSEPAVPVTPCSKDEDFPAMINSSSLGSDGVYKLVLTEPKEDS